MQIITWKKRLALGIIVLFVCASIASSYEIRTESNKSPIGKAILYVGGSGPGNYTKIQDAIDNASDGDTVFVYNGTYYEDVWVNKSINLIGEDRNITTIEANVYSIYLIADWVNISGFTITNGSNFGIVVRSEENTISSNNILNNYKGVDLEYSNYNNISGNIISNNTFGVHLDTYNSNNIIKGNFINSNYYDGVVLYRHCDYNVIFGNIFNANGKGIRIGFNSINNIIRGNKITSNYLYGIQIYSSCTNNVIYHNNLINNNITAFDGSTNSWYNATLQEGNYYDDYNGSDATGDGIGDKPYNITGGSNQDLHPLMYPWYPSHPDTVYVDDDYNISSIGFGYDRFNRIQYGINEVEGSTVYVYNGTYYEHVTVDKTINLIGENRSTTVIDGVGAGDVVRIIADSVTISQFTIQNGGNGAENWDAGIEVYQSRFNSILNNHIIGPYNHGTRAVNIWFSTADNNIVSGNNLSDNKYGLVFWDSNTNNIIKNNIYNSSYYGISFSKSSNKNQIYHNNFIKNNHSSWDECNNTWNSSYPSGGNYWSDYTEDDLYNGPNQDIPGSDGIGDIPYEILCEHGIDYYPLMKPDGWINSPANVPNKPSGETIILPGIDYNYTSSTIDPDGDSIWYKWDWGDGSYSDWLGPYGSGEEVSTKASWSKGTYEIRVKAKDSRNPETDWSEPLTVNVIYPNFKTVLLFGFINNLIKSTDYYSFNVVKLLWIGFNPIFPEILSSNEIIVVSDVYFGRLKNLSIIGFFNAMVLT